MQMCTSRREQALVICKSAVRFRRPAPCEVAVSSRRFRHQLLGQPSTNLSTRTAYFDSLTMVPAMCGPHCTSRHSGSVLSHTSSLDLASVPRSDPRRLAPRKAPSWNGIDLSYLMTLDYGPCECAKVDRRASAAIDLRVCKSRKLDATSFKNCASFSL